MLHPVVKTTINKPPWLPSKNGFDHLVPHVILHPKSFGYRDQKNGGRCGELPRLFLAKRMCAVSSLHNQRVLYHIRLISKESIVSHTKFILCLI